MPKPFDEAAYRASLTPELAAPLAKMAAEVSKPKRQRNRRRPPGPPAPPKAFPTIDYAARIDAIIADIAATRPASAPPA